MNEAEVKTQWHPAFCAAMRLELRENKADLGYEPEYTLNMKPLLIDLLVIKLEKSVIIKNEIGRIFRGHNILEYKSPLDELNIDTYFKTLAYANLYKANASTVDGIKADDITITIVRREKPVKLFEWFAVQGYEVEEAYKGIYYVKSHDFYAIQIVASRELSKAEHTWLMALTDDMKHSDAEQLVYCIHDLVQSDDREYADAVLQLAIKENQVAFGVVKDGEYMCEALMELMKPEFDAAVNAAEARSDARRLVQSVEANMRNFNIDLETACRGNDITVERYESAKELLAGIEKK